MRNRFLMLISILVLAACSKPTSSTEPSANHLETLSPTSPVMPASPVTPAAPAEAAPTVAPGTDIGSGTGGLDPRNEAAWFLVAKKEKIKTCLLIHPKFPFTEDELKVKLQWAFTTWNEYSKQHLNFRDSFLSFAYELDFQSHCDGTEDLTVSFGEALEKVKPHLERLKNPPALVVRQSYDVNDYWGKGILWVAPPGLSYGGIHYNKYNPLLQNKTVLVNWNEPGFLDGTLLHEVGHIFGVGHVPDTIMDDSLVYKFARAIEAKSAISNKYIFYQIDGHRELLLCEDCKDKTYTGLFGRNLEEAMVLAKEIFGIEKLEGTARAELRLEEGFSSHGSRHSLVLMLPEGRTEVLTVELSGNTDRLADFSTEPIFRQWLKYFDPLRGDLIELRPSAMLHYGSFKDKTGKQHTVLLKRNAAFASTMQLNILRENGREQILFLSVKDDLIGSLKR